MTDQCKLWATGSHSFTESLGVRPRFTLVEGLFSYRISQGEDMKEKVLHFCLVSSPQCSVTCGQGYQLRAVKCVIGPYMSVVDDNDCNAATRPTDTQVSLPSQPSY